MRGKIFNKAFFTLFATLSLAHIMEDMVWAVLARYTSVPLLILLVGIVAWSFATAVIVKIWGRKI
tara:strand:- start:560 stop:754 length:195 start_codon:yes stop_codon:yes gene_type:complete